MKIALEEEKGILGRIWDMIMSVFKWIGEKISQFVNWVKGLFGGGKPKKAEQVIQKAADAKIQLKITAKPINLHGGAAQSGTESAAGHAVVSSETQQKILKDQSASLQKALKTLDSSAPATNSNPLPAVRKIKEADKSNQVQEITSANVTDVLEKVVERKNTLPLTDRQIKLMRMLVRNKDEFIKLAKSTDLTEIAALKNSAVTFIKEVIKLIENVNFDAIAENARAHLNVGETANLIFKEIYSTEFINKTFGKILSDSKLTTNTITDKPEQIYTLSVNKAILTFSGVYAYKGSDFMELERGIEHFNRTAKYNPDDTVIYLASDVTFLSKNISSITEKLKNDIGKIEKDLTILKGDFNSQKDPLEEFDKKSLSYLDKLPEGEEKDEIKFHIKRVRSLCAFMISLGRHLLTFFQRITNEVIHDYHTTTTDIMDIADVLNRANIKSDASIDWLNGLSKV